MNAAQMCAGAGKETWDGGEEARVRAGGGGGGGGGEQTRVRALMALRYLLLDHQSGEKVMRGWVSYIYKLMCVCVCVCINIHTHTHTHTHI